MKTVVTMIVIMDKMIVIMVTMIVIMMTMIVIMDKMMKKIVICCSPGGSSP